MRDTWTITTLEELVSTGVVSLGRGNVISKKDMEADPGPYPVYSSAQNNDGRIGSYNKYMFDEELITWSVDGGGHVFYRPHHKFSVTNIGGYLRILDESKFLYPFLAAVLRKLHAEHVFDWQNKAHPSVIRKLYNNIPLAPIEEQKRIVDVVSSVDAYIDSLQQQADSARTARNAVLHELLSAGGDDWTETILGDIAKCAGGSAFPHEFQGGDTGTPFVKVSDMNEAGNERFLNSSKNYVSKEAIKSLGARVWPKGTVVFAKVGAALLTEKRRILVQDTIFDNNIMGLVPKDSIESHFLYLFMETVRLGDFVQPGAVPSVNNSIVSEIEINLPPVEEQKRIVEIVSSMDDVIQATENAMADAKNLRSGLLSDLLSGEHEIPASYDKFLGAA
jgi:type I restriction enzyme S subunit